MVESTGAVRPACMHMHQHSKKEWRHTCEQHSSHAEQAPTIEDAARLCEGALKDAEQYAMLARMPQAHDSHTCLAHRNSGTPGFSSDGCKQGFV
jgi:hypothetical protein